MIDTIANSISQMSADLIRTRHYLHENPELSDFEERTSAFVADRLRAMGLEVRTSIGGNGAVADIVGRQPGRTIAIRADMDALPIKETPGKAYCSQNNGVM